MTRPAWDDYFLGIAVAVATRADCTRRQVGCVLVDRAHRVIATGYNGAPSGQPGCASAGACPRGRSDVPTRSKYDTGPGACIAVHAEDNAVRYASGWQELSGATAYVTCEPCPPCYGILRGVGIARVVWPKDAS